MTEDSERIIFYSKWKGPDGQHRKIKLEISWGPILEKFK